MKKVYGLMINSGTANEMLWDMGVWETEEAAKTFLEQEMSNVNGIWIEGLTVNDAIPGAAEDESDEMVICSLCGIVYNEADVNTDDYDEDVCIYCEPEYRKSIASL
ncbi:hypothetical protein [Bacillus sp. T33-2]|uniref:hypothetical protein n=1 Tax=Bacillus sp. T33-2 TaxID=2054168 RepID=UPI000C7584CE|nr:hypothetical protein [Bacillus sp. T33-2]PLR98795.1 hypothetical protein CVD19_03935 [Bacillus sp. T33-2]